MILPPSKHLKWLFTSIVLYFNFLVFLSCGLQNWNKLSENEASNHFTEFELCMTHGKYDCKPFNEKRFFNCEIHGKNRGHVSKVCPNKFAPLLKHISTKNWPDSMNFTEIISYLKSKSSDVLIMIGDSMMEQQFHNFGCATEKLGFYNVKWIIDPFIEEFQTYQFQDSNKLEKSNNFYVHLLKYGNENSGLRFSSLRQIIIEKIYPFINFKNDEKVIYMFNFGLRYRHLSVMKKEVVPILRFLLNEINRNYSNIVLYRETLATHFPTEDGLYSENFPKPSLVFRNATNSIYKQNDYNHMLPDDYVCRPLNNSKAIFDQNWRNRFMLEKLLPSIDKDKKIKILRAYEMSLERFDLHFSGKDCTHYCIAPLLWLPIWHDFIKIVKYDFDKTL